MHILLLASLNSARNISKNVDLTSIFSSNLFIISFKIDRFAPQRFSYFVFNRRNFWKMSRF